MALIRWSAGRVHADIRERHSVPIRRNFDLAAARCVRYHPDQAAADDRRQGSWWVYKFSRQLSTAYLMFLLTHKCRSRMRTRRCLATSLTTATLVVDRPASRPRLDRTRRLDCKCGERSKSCDCWYCVFQGNAELLAHAAGVHGFDLMDDRMKDNDG